MNSNWGWSWFIRFMLMPLEKGMTLSTPNCGLNSRRNWPFSLWMATSLGERKILNSKTSLKQDGLHQDVFTWKHPLLQDLWYDFTLSGIKIIRSAIFCYGKYKFCVFKTTMQSCVWDLSKSKMAQICSIGFMWAVLTWP